MRESKLKSWEWIQYRTSNSGIVLLLFSASNFCTTVRPIDNLIFTQRTKQTFHRQTQKIHIANTANQTKPLPCYCLYQIAPRLERLEESPIIFQHNKPTAHVALCLAFGHDKYIFDTSILHYSILSPRLSR